VVRNCTVTPTAMGAALQFIGTTDNRLNPVWDGSRLQMLQNIA